MLETEWISAVLGITLNNSLISQRQHVPYTLRSLSQLISSPRVSPVFSAGTTCRAVGSRRTWQANHVQKIWICARDKSVRERSGRCRLMRQQYLQKVTGLSRGTRLSLGQKRKGLMSALIVAKPCIDCRAAVCGRSGPGGGGGEAAPGGGEGGRGLSQPLAGASVSEICLSSSFVLLPEMLWPDIRRRKSILLQSSGRPSGISAAHRRNY